MKTLILCIQAFTYLVTLSKTGTHAKQIQGLDALRWIDPLIGSRDGGNVFAGATLPYSMAKG